jgi:hypothetical protein
MTPSLHSTFVRHPGCCHWLVPFEFSILLRLSSLCGGSPTTNSTYWARGRGSTCLGFHFLPGSITPPTVPLICGPIGPSPERHKRTGPSDNHLTGTRGLLHLAFAHVCQGSNSHIIPRDTPLLLAIFYFLIVHPNLQQHSMDHEPQSNPPRLPNEWLQLQLIIR